MKCELCSIEIGTGTGHPTVKVTFHVMGKANVDFYLCESDAGVIGDFLAGHGGPIQDFAMRRNRQKYQFSKQQLEDPEGFLIHDLSVASEGSE